MAHYRPILATYPGPRYERCLDDALIVFRKAADEWALGSPEQPPAPEVLKQVLCIFEVEKFLRRPF